MKAKKLFALAAAGLLALSLLAGCGGSDKNNDSGKGNETAGDPAKPAGYYQWTYEVDGLGTWVNYLHLYEESSIGNVYYLGIAANQISQAGTYEVVKEPCDYEVYFERGTESDPGDLQKGTADYTIIFYDFDGVEKDRCAYDGTYIYNDTKTVCGTGCEQIRMTKDNDGLEGKSGQADSGYQGEVGISILKAANAEDSTLYLQLNHNGTYSDLVGDYAVDGTWEMKEDGIYTLTPDDKDASKVTVEVSLDYTTCTYTSEDGTSTELTIDNSKPVFKDLAGAVYVEAIDMDVDIHLYCYTDNTAELRISVGDIGLPYATGTYTTNEDGTITFELGDFGTLTTNADLTVDVSIDANDFGLGELNDTLEPAA